MQVEAWLARAARTAPETVAIETPAARVSYEQLWGAALAAAQELADRGVRRGEPVAIALPAGIDFAVALHACLLLGAVAVPLDLRLTAAEREHARAGARVLLDALDTPFVATPFGGQPRRLGEGGSSAFEPASENANTPPLAANTPPFSQKEDREKTMPSPPVGEDDRRHVHDLDAVCAVIHTSGTTSQARPVRLTYGNFLWSALGSGVALGVDPRERWLCTLPLAHVGGLSILLRSAIYATTAVIHERFETEHALAALMGGEITLVSLVATTLARLLDAGLREPPRLRHALTGGGPVPEALVTRAETAGVPVATTYGLTEACSQVSTSGPPLFCTRVAIGADGEILVAGPTVAPAAPGPDGWLHTGDLGWLDEKGGLHVAGRAAETIVSGGENVSPSEVEAVLEAHPAVLEAAVLGREDPEWGEAVTAIVVLRAPPDRAADPPFTAGSAAPSEPLSAHEVALGEELRSHCAASLAPFKVPKRVTFSTAPLPRTRSGKLLRREL